METLLHTLFLVIVGGGLGLGVIVYILLAIYREPPPSGW